MSKFMRKRTLGFQSYDPLHVRQKPHSGSLSEAFSSVCVQTVKVLMKLNEQTCLNLRCLPSCDII